MSTTELNDRLHARDVQWGEKLGQEIASAALDVGAHVQGARQLRDAVLAALSGRAVPIAEHERVVAEYIAHHARADQSYERLRRAIRERVELLNENPLDEWTAGDLAAELRALLGGEDQ